MRLFKLRLVAQHYWRRGFRRGGFQFGTTPFQTAEIFFDHLDQSLVIEVACRGDDEIIRPIDFVVISLNSFALERRERIGGAKHRPSERVIWIEVFAEDVEDD